MILLLLQLLIIWLIEEFHALSQGSLGFIYPSVDLHYTVGRCRHELLHGAINTIFDLLLRLLLQFSQYICGVRWSVFLERVDRHVISSWV